MQTRKQYRSKQAKKHMHANLDRTNVKQEKIIYFMLATVMIMMASVLLTTPFLGNGLMPLRWILAGICFFTAVWALVKQDKYNNKKEEK